MFSQIMQHDLTVALLAFACAVSLVLVVWRHMQRVRDSKTPRRSLSSAIPRNSSSSSIGSLTTTCFPGKHVSIDSMTQEEFRAFEAEVRRQSGNASMDVAAAIRALRPVAARYQDPATCPPFDDVYMARLGLSAGFAPEACDERLAAIQRWHRQAGGVRLASADFQRWPMLFVPFEDTYGRPCLVYRLATLQLAIQKNRQSSDFEPKVLAEAISAYLDASMVYMLKKREESKSRPVKNPLEQTVFVLDLDGLNFFSSDITSVVQTGVNSLALDANYPTQVGQNIILSAGTMFMRMFQVSKGCMHESTLLKLEMVGAADSRSRIQNLVHPDHRARLTAEYGGPAGPLPQPGVPADFEVLFGAIAASAWQGLGLKRPVGDGFRIRVSGGPAMYRVFVELGSSDKTTSKVARSSSDMLLFLEDHEPSEEQGFFACCTARSRAQAGAAAMEMRLNALIAQGGHRKKAALSFAGFTDVG